MSKINYIRLELKNNLDQEEIIEHIKDTLVELKKLNDDFFGNWYEQSTSRKKSMEKVVNVDYESIKEIVLKNWDKKFPELGTYFKLWTGNIIDEDNFMISFKLGNNSKRMNFVNSVVLDFPNNSKNISINKLDSFSTSVKMVLESIWKNSVLIIN